MKKRVIIIISIVLMVVLAVGIGVYVLMDTSHEPMAKIRVADYDRHSAVQTQGNTLVQVGARLYYSVDTYNNPIKYGVYEITNRGIERIWWDGIKSIGSMESYHSNLAVYEDQLAEVDPLTGEISLFDFDTGEFVKQEGIYSEYVQKRNEYQQYQTENDSAVLYTTLFGRTYYIVDRSAEPVLYMDSPAQDEDVIIYDFAEVDGGAVCSNIYSVGATVYVEFYSNSQVHCIQYYPERDEVVHVSPEDYGGKSVSTEYAVYVNNPYPYEEGDPTVGIFVTDLETKEKTRVYEGYVRDWHILDSEWVYFTLEDHSLWRVSLDGETLEQVF